MYAPLLPLLLLAGGLTPPQETLTLADGDRVAWIGNTFVEREQRDGYIELALTLALPHANVTYRNLGWSGDTVDGRARRFFGPTRDGFEHLLRHVDVVDPTVVLVSYGTNAAFEGEAGRARFLTGYAKLLDALTKRTKRIALVTSPPLEPASSPAPRVAEQTNAELGWQAARLRALASERGLAFVDLFTPLFEGLTSSEEPGPLTDNGVHLTPLGYQSVARVLTQQLGLGQGPGPEPTGPADRAHEELRLKILAKNAAFFHRHRPQNETYLRGFRRHEQGNNAVEIEAFEPYVLRLDQEIFELRRSLR